MTPKQVAENIYHVCSQMVKGYHVCSQMGKGERGGMTSLLVNLKIVTQVAQVETVYMLKSSTVF